MKSPSKKRDPWITEYIADAEPFARPILKHLRKLIHEACPQAEEAVKWHMPTFMYNGKILVGIAGFKAHCALWFWKGSNFLKAESGAKLGKAMGNFGRITSLDDLPSDAAIKKYIKLAMKANDEAAAAAKVKKPARASRKVSPIKIGRS